MRQLFQRKVHLAQANMPLWRLQPCQQHSDKWWTAVTYARPPGSSVAKSPLVLKTVCAPVCASWMLPGWNVCVRRRVCVHLCPLMFLYECLACRGGWSGLENILCDSTSGRASLAFDVPPLITATPGLFIQRALVHSASVGGRWNNTKFRVSAGWGRKKQKTKQR